MIFETSWANIFANIELENSSALEKDLAYSEFQPRSLGVEYYEVNAYPSELAGLSKKTVIAVSIVML